MALNGRPGDRPAGGGPAAIQDPIINPILESSIFVQSQLTQLQVDLSPDLRQITDSWSPPESRN